MTITDPTETVADGEPVELEPELCWLNLADMAPHPDNPRHTLGDLTELTRSIRAHGIIEPLVVLPADDHGVSSPPCGRSAGRGDRGACGGSADDAGGGDRGRVVGELEPQ